MRITRLRDPLAWITAQAQATNTSSASPARGWKAAIIRTGRAMIPFDSSFLWSWRAARHARRLTTASPPSVLLTSAPPFSTTLAGYLVKRRLGAARWIHELRDLVSTNPIYAWGNLRRRLNFKIEKHLLSKADGFIFLTELIEQEYRERYAAPAVGIVAYNGYEPSFAAAAQSDTLLPSGELRILHAGNFYGSRSPLPFLHGLRLALDRVPELEKHLQVTFVGTLGQSPVEIQTAQDCIRQLRLTSHVQTVATIPHEELGKHYRCSSLLLLITHTDATSRYAIPGKLFEYIGCGRKVLAVTEDPLPCRLIKQHDLGWTTPSSETSIADTLQEIYRASQQSGGLEIPTQTIAKFTFEQQTRRIEKLFLSLPSR